jgi:hypothetical protein
MTSARTLALTTPPVAGTPLNSMRCA